MAATLNLCDATKPRRFDLTMSRRTRRPAASSVVDCHQDQDMEMEGSQLNVQQQQGAELKSFEEHITLQQQLDGEDDETAMAQQQGQDNSRRLSLKELMDEAINGDADKAATGSQGENAIIAAVHEAAEADAASATEQTGDVAASARVMGMVRRYVRVQSIKGKRSPEKKVVVPL